MSPFALARTLTAASIVSLATAPLTLISYSGWVCGSWLVLSLLSGLWAYAEQQRVRTSRRKVRGMHRLFREVANVRRLPSTRELLEGWEAQR